MNWKNIAWKDSALLILRLTVGSLMAGHGAQKLFGWFGGRGFDGTQQFVRSLGLQPRQFWATGLVMGEFGGGLLTALGLLNPLGPIGILATMSMATAKAHRDKPIWATKGGAELPVTNAAVAVAVGLAGPGRYSLDRVLGIRVPRAVSLLALALAAVLVIIGNLEGPKSEPESPAPTRDEERTSRPVQA